MRQLRLPSLFLCVVSTSSRRNGDRLVAAIIGRFSDPHLSPNRDVGSDVRFDVIAAQIKRDILTFGRRYHDGFAFRVFLDGACCRMGFGLRGSGIGGCRSRLIGLRRSLSAYGAYNKKSDRAQSQDQLHIICLLISIVCDAHEDPLNKRLKWLH